MDLSTLTAALLADRRASHYILSLPKGEFEEHLKALGIQHEIVQGDDPQLYRLVGRGYYPVVYTEYGVVFETDVPSSDVAGCLECARENPIPPPRIVVAYLTEPQCMLLRRSIQFMCLARSEPQVKRVAPKRARVTYDCRVGEHWVEIHFSRQVIPAEQRMSA